MLYTYKTWGVCSTGMEIELDDEGIIRSIRIENGCEGNLQGLASLAQDQPAHEVMRRLAGIRCGGKATSCPDQLALALSGALQQLERKQPARRAST